MNKTTKIILIILAVVLVVGVIAIALMPKKEETNNDAAESTPQAKLEPITSAEGLVTLVDKVYEGVDLNLLPKLETTTVDVSETDMIAMLTGLENGDDLEYFVISQPLMTSQAYSFVLAKVKDGVDANAVAKKMCEQVDTRRWICVEAEQVYATNSGDVVCLVMGNSQTAKAVYDNFKTQAGVVGQEHEKSVEID